MTTRSALLLFAALSPLAGAQDRIATDRPDFTETTSAVAKGTWQLETGFSYVVVPGFFAFRGPEALVRLGMGNRWEARLGLPGWERVRAGGMTDTGWGDGALGAKFELGACHAWNTALIAETTVPTGTNGFGSAKWDQAVRFVADRDLCTNWTIASMLSLATRHDGNRRVVDGEATLALGQSLCDRLGVFYEYAGVFPKDMRPGHLFHTGLAFQPTPDQQWDVHFGVSLVKSSPGTLVGAGYSRRF